MMHYYRNVKLNGVVLTVSSDGELPDLKAKSIENTGSFTLPGYAIEFWVFEDTNVEVCTS